MTESHSDRSHSWMSPSGFERDLRCPGNRKISEGIEDNGTPAANQGTAAHMLSEHCLNHGFDPAEFKGRTIDITKDGNAMFVSEKEDGDVKWPVDDEMVSGVNMYIEYARTWVEKGYEVETEAAVSLDHVIPDVSGHSDLLAYHEGDAHLVVGDLKYGAGVVVEAHGSAQGMGYAIGALRRYDNRPVKKVTIAIVQPRAYHAKGPIREWDTDPFEIAVFAEAMREAGEMAQSDNPPLNPGDWCTFCKGAPVCPALRELSFSYALEDFDEVTMASNPDPDTVADWLQKIDMIETWCKRVREFANAEGQAGRIPTGFKFVWKKAMRKWTDEEAMPSTLETIFELDRDQIYTEPKVKSVAQIEKVIGKKRIKTLQGFVSQQSSGRVLVPESDPRPPAALDAADEFEAVETG